ncbi:beta-1,3-galactosyltransferase 5 [Nilaparvata lugens]|uniref:beta-1,3-galactosyltransferase 5 n=1 Tax=Nilaparvata lugens TaxID=108931 RepID=UPI00193CDA51|nr:beta-1,3-galactosyltransferase 5 [Nilaparvata lugens]
MMTEWHELLIVRVNALLIKYNSLLNVRFRFIVCNLTKYDAMMVWKQFLIFLLLFTILIILLFLEFGENLNSDPFLKYMFLPRREELGFFRVENDLLETPQEGQLIDFEDFKYMIDQPCDSILPSFKAVLLITSFAGNIESRSAIRRAYPRSVIEKLGIRRVFLLGKLKQKQSDITQNAIIHENERYLDILQGNFLEAYRNLTYKHTMGLRWAATRCKDVKFIIKMDDDIVVDLYKLSTIIDENQGGFDMMGYLLEGMKPIRLEANKWFVPKEEFQLSSYPKFLSGWLYVTTPDFAKCLIKQSTTEKYFWIDDVYVSGILAQKCNVKFVDIREFFTLHPEYYECCIRKNISCNYVAGPNGGDNGLIVKYEKHIRNCSEQKCAALKLTRNTCLTQRKIPSIGKGFVELKQIKL